MAQLNGTQIIIKPEKMEEFARVLVDAFIEKNHLLCILTRIEVEDIERLWVGFSAGTVIELVFSIEVEVRKFCLLEKLQFNQNTLTFSSLPNA